VSGASRMLCSGKVVRSIPAVAPTASDTTISQPESLVRS
jgi:hypothetical protein